MWLPKIKQIQIRRAFYYNQTARDLPEFNEGATVRDDPIKKHKEWMKAKVQKRKTPRSFEVITESGKLMRRNRRDLRSSHQSSRYQNGYLGEVGEESAGATGTTSDRSLQEEDREESADVTGTTSDYSIQDEDRGVVSGTFKISARVSRFGKVINESDRFGDFVYG